MQTANVILLPAKFVHELHAETLAVANRVEIHRHALIQELRCHPYLTDLLINDSKCIVDVFLAERHVDVVENGPMKSRNSKGVYCSVKPDKQLSRWPLRGIYSRLKIEVIIFSINIAK